MLQRLALIAPDDLYGIALIVKDALKHAEKDYALRRRKGVRYALLVAAFTERLAEGAIGL